MRYENLESFDFTHKDFNLDHATDKDLQFCKMLFKEKMEWKLISTSKKHKANVYVCRKNYFGSKFKLFGREIYKFDMILPHHIEKCVYATGSTSFLSANSSIIECEPKYINLINAKDIKPISTSSCDVEIAIKSPPPFQTVRKFYQNYTHIFDDDTGECILIAKPHTRTGFMKDISLLDGSKKHTSMVKGKSMEVYLHMFYSFYKLKKIDDNTTSYTFIAFISKEGWKSKRIINDKITDIITDKVLGPEIMKIFTTDMKKTLSNVPKDFSLTDRESKDEFYKLLVDGKIKEKLDSFSVKTKKKDILK